MTQGEKLMAVPKNEEIIPKPNKISEFSQTFSLADIMNRYITVKLLNVSDI